MNVFLYIICNFEIFATVSSSMSSKMATKVGNPIYWWYSAVLSKIVTFLLLVFFDINCDVSCQWTVHNQGRTRPASGQRQQMLVDQKVKKFTELLPCTLAMYDCRQLEDVSSVDNDHRITEIPSQICIRCCLLQLPLIISLCHRHLVHLNWRDHFIWLHIQMYSILLPILPCIQLHQQFLSLDHQIICVQQPLWAVCSEPLT